LTAQGEVLGTPSYMSPEQATGQTDRIGRQTDVYGLGALVDQVLTGQAPFTGSSAAEVMLRVRDEEPTRPRQQNRSVPAALEAICLRALTKRQQRGRLPEADTQFRLAIEVQERAALSPSGKADDRQTLARYHYDLAMRLRGQDTKGEPHFRQSVAILRKLADDYPYQHLTRNMLASYLFRLSVVLYALGQVEESERFVAEVMEIRRRLIQDFPDKAECHYEFAWFLDRRGRRLRQEAATRQEALALFEEAARRQHRALALNPHHGEYRKLLHDIYQDLTVTLLELGDHAAAARAAEEMARAMPDGWQACRRAAGMLVRCMRVANRDASLTAAERRARNQIYAEQAVNLLRAAVQRDFKDVAELRQSKDWAPLHKHAEFLEVTGGAP
jgi:tetratricopeptide (TPR) repeat protein